MMKTVSEIEKQLRERIGADIEREKWGIAAHECLADLIKEKWAGKKINARIADQFKSRFLAQFPVADQEKVRVRYERKYSWAEITIEGVGPWKDYSDRGTFMLGYDAELGQFALEAFENHDCCHGQPAKERNIQRIKLCQNGELEKLSQAIWNEIQARNTRTKLTEYGTPGNEVRYFAEEIAIGKA